MTERPDALVMALARLVRAAAETDRREAAERRRNLTIVEQPKRRNVA